MNLKHESRPYMMSLEGWTELEFKARGWDFLADLDLKGQRLINYIARIEESSAYVEPAIRWYSRVYFTANGPCTALEYAAGINSKISELVNK
jgi:hypothetical protein